MFSTYRPGSADLPVTQTAMKAWRVLVHAKRAERRKCSNRDLAAAQQANAWGGRSGYAPFPGTAMERFLGLPDREFSGR